MHVEYGNKALLLLCRLLYYFCMLIRPSIITDSLLLDFMIETTIIFPFMHCRRSPPVVYFFTLFVHHANSYCELLGTRIVESSSAGLDGAATCCPTLFPCTSLLADAAFLQHNHLVNIQCNCNTCYLPTTDLPTLQPCGSLKQELTLL